MKEEDIKKILELFAGYGDGCGCCEVNSIGEWINGSYVITDEFVKEVQNKLEKEK